MCPCPCVCVSLRVCTPARHVLRPCNVRGVQCVCGVCVYVCVCTASPRVGRGERSPPPPPPPPPSPCPAGTGPGWRLSLRYSRREASAAEVIHRDVFYPPPRPVLSACLSFGSALHLEVRDPSTPLHPPAPPPKSRGAPRKGAVWGSHSSWEGITPNKQKAKKRAKSLASFLSNDRALLVILSGG